MSWRGDLVKRWRAFQEAVVRFVPDDTELGQRIAHGKAPDDFSDEFGMVAEDVRVLFEDGRTDHASIKPACASS
jgi:hypothetical protein